jgi:AcrR family transcriptional regulator
MPNAGAQPARARSNAKELLLEATAELIAEVGWGNVSSRMVAERAGLNNALVHYHFESMEDLLRRAAEKVVSEAFATPTLELSRQDLAVAMKAAVTWLERLDIFATETGVLVESLAQARRDPALQEHAAKELETLRAGLTKALEDEGGRLGSIGARGLATLLLATLDGLLLHRVVDPGLSLRPAARSIGAWLEIAAGSRRER